MAYQIQKADLDNDGEVIIDFWKRNFPIWPVQKFQWFYRENIYGLADCWLLKKTGSGDIVGAQAVFPRLVYCNGKPFLAGIIGDLGVDERHRTLGPALQLQKAAAESCRKGKYAFLYGYPNERSEPVAKRAGFQVVGNSVRVARVIRSEKYLSRVIRAPLLPWIARKVIDLGVGALARESRIRVERDCQPVLLERTDKRFDELFEKSRKHYGVIGERGHAFLTWRFTNCPFRQYQIFSLKRGSDGSLAGYIIFYQQDGVVHLSDMLAETPQLLDKAILPAFLRFVRKGECDSVSVEFMSPNYLLDCLSQFHFRIRAGNRNIVAFSEQKGEVTQQLFEPENWYFLAADNDG